MADQAVSSLSSAILRRINGLLAKFVVTLDPTHRQLIDINVAEFVTSTDSHALISLLDVLCVPFLPQALVSGHIVKHLIMHGRREAG